MRMPSFCTTPQADDDKILKVLKRVYSPERCIAVVNNIRNVMPNAAIACDLIVGLSSAREGLFERSLDLMREILIDVLSTESYSTRPNAPATVLENQVAE
jgi:tRNA A37 methylthiotransferase MiaB